MKIPKTFPDLQALSYARAHARATGDEAALRHFERLHERSSAWGGGYGTNIPLLASVLAIAPPGPVLELGAGNFSTLLLSEMCRAMGRKLVTIEVSEDWARRFADMPGAAFTGDPGVGAHVEPHRFCRVDNDTQFSSAALTHHPDAFVTAGRADEKRWAVVLVDHAAGPGRTDAIEFLRDRADYIVVHDTNNSFFTGVDDALSSFRFRFDYTALCPTTTVVSEKYAYPQTPHDSTQLAFERHIATRRAKDRALGLDDNGDPIPDLDAFPPSPRGETLEYATVLKSPKTLREDGSIVQGSDYPMLTRRGGPAPDDGRLVVTGHNEFGRMPHSEGPGEEDIGEAGDETPGSA